MRPEPRGFGRFLLDADSIRRVKQAQANALSGRLESLDVFRGATIAAMILVNNPGDWSTVYWPLLHVPWHGWTPTDLVFPFFLFIVGVALTLSKRASFKAALLRALKLVGLGLFLALYPSFQIASLRWPGVLQRIGLCYLAAWAARRWLGPRGQAALAAILLVGYWALMTKVTGPEGFPPNLEMHTNLAAQVDRLFLTGHMWAATKTWDPEGLLSTLPSIATPLLGLLCGAWLRGREQRSPFRTTLGLVLSGLGLVLVGVLWGEAAPRGMLFPIKPLASLRPDAEQPPDAGNAAALLRAARHRAPRTAAGGAVRRCRTAEHSGGDLVARMERSAIRERSFHHRSIMMLGAHSQIALRSIWATGNLTSSAAKNLPCTACSHSGP